ncbi:Pr6Pr family membrane protein [Devosia sp.]|uniref:Pr6Pr family membrane protein n=1 Tax=Devosia sp. TaxID=1871048 RepID=UPI0029300B4A|nr:Pr6Pr family membrane protein [Devosia sp.]
MSARAPVDPRKLLTWLGLFFGAAGLVLQFWLSMQLAFANGRDWPGFLGHFFAFYTILSNVILVLIYLSEVLPTPRLALFRRPVVRGMMVANIALVALYVYFVLRHLNALEGLNQLADTILHYLCPTLYLLWWLVAQPRGTLRWGDLPAMLLPTLVYFIYIMARGVWVQQYPYPTLNAVELGYPQVLLNAVYMAAGLGALCAIVIALDGLLARQFRTI